MKFHYLLLLSILFYDSKHAYSQKLDWVCNGQNVSIEWKYGSLGKNNCMVVGGPVTHCDPSPPMLFDAAGEDTTTNKYENTDLVICYTSAGKKNWSLNLDNQYSELCGITCNNNGETCLLISASEYTENDRGKGIAAIPDFKKGNKHLKPGYYIAVINSHGKNTRLKYCNINSELTITQFKLHPNGNFLLSGYGYRDDGIVTKRNNIIFAKDGGDFILMLGKNGKFIWGDVISYRDTDCCAQTIMDCSKIAVDETGTIYVGGGFIHAAEFGKKIIKRTKPDNKKINSKSEETFLASYSAKGKLNWVTTSMSHCSIQCLTTNKTNIAMGLSTIQTDSIFGEKFDTTNKKKYVICIFNKNGEIKKTIAPNSSIEDIAYKNENELFVLGINSQNSKTKRHYFTKDSFEKKNNVALASFNTIGDILKFKTAYLPVYNAWYPFKFFIGSDSNFYLYGHTVYIRDIDLNDYDRAFHIEVYRGYGSWNSTPFVVRILNK